MIQAPERPASPSRTPRFVYALLQIAVGAALVWLAFITEEFEKVYKHLEMRELPLWTDLAIVLARGVRVPLGLATLGLVEAALVGLALRGSLDRRLGRGIRITLIVLVLMVPAWMLAVYMPILRIREALSK
ncbi:MAG TPA: hypothetical protein VKW04_14355 [Planctomycetota bacterium]|nr:hypothetical protein [Planctomycetota bacterium]